MSAKTKGWMKNLVSGEKKSFQYNPESFTHGRSATYAEMNSPGQNYPNTAFVKGDSVVFTVDLFQYDRQSSGIITDFEAFLNGFLPPETYNSSFIEPPEMLFCMGAFIRTCVLESVSTTYEIYDSELNPVQARFSLQLRQVGV